MLKIKLAHYWGFGFLNNPTSKGEAEESEHDSNSAEDHSSGGAADGANNEPNNSKRDIQPVKPAQQWDKAQQHAQCGQYSQN